MHKFQLLLRILLRFLNRNSIDEILTVADSEGFNYSSLGGFRWRNPKISWISTQKIILWPIKISFIII